MQIGHEAAHIRRESNGRSLFRPTNARLEHIIVKSGKIQTKPKFVPVITDICERCLETVDAAGHEPQLIAQSAVLTKKACVANDPKTDRIIVLLVHFKSDKKQHYTKTDPQGDGLRAQPTDLMQLKAVGRIFIESELLHVLPIISCRIDRF